jgi:hypothetical protein
MSAEENDTSSTAQQHEKSVFVYRFTLQIDFPWVFTDHETAHPRLYRVSRKYVWKLCERVPG